MENPPLYGEYKIKHEVRERDGQKCRECGMTSEEHKKLTGRTLDVHRIVQGSVYTLDGCLTLCQKCHSKIPKARRPYTKSRGLLHVQLRRLAAINASTVGEEIRIAIRERLERLNLWPIDRTRRG